ncbi:hypothetical protein AALP_AA5G087600 [Arabis alpina]|uniref:MBD domain-containing protein n=1 Tax=Arabis alpina TaxID=50452 RepID=A0A087GVT8_ARAAL|nr:hypothetical protein AALP_AA5G087600 [Arabis alpina]
MSNDTDQVQPPPENTPPRVESKPRKRASPAGDNWLPPGWTTQEKVRTSGTKAGTVDKFYYEPVTGRKFRSKTEVMYYVEHGTPKKPGKKAESGETPSEHSEGQGSIKRPNRSRQKANEPPPPPQPPKPLNFDFLNVPEKVTWTGSKDAWWPVIGDYKIQESVCEDWHRAFTLITSQKHGTTKF